MAAKVASEANPALLGNLYNFLTSNIDFLRGSCSLSYLHPQFKIWFISFKLWLKTVEETRVTAKERS